MNGNDTFLDVNDAHLRVTSGNVYASAFNLDQIDIVMSSNTASTVNFNNPAKAFNAASNIEVGTANLFVDTTTTRVGVGTASPATTLDVAGDLNVSGNLTIIGTTTTLDTDHLRVKDPIIELGKDNTASPGVDLGLVMTRPSGSSNVGIIFDESATRLEIGYTQGTASDSTITMDSTPLSVNVNGTISGNGSGLTALNAANITTGTLDRNTTGSAATLTTPRTIGGVNFDGSADIVPTTFGAATFDTDTLVVDSVNDRVGIGTTTPDAKLNVKSGVFLSENQASTNNMVLYFDGGGIGGTNNNQYNRKDAKFGTGIFVNDTGTTGSTITLMNKEGAANTTKHASIGFVLTDTAFNGKFGGQIGFWPEDSNAVKQQFRIYTSGTQAGYNLPVQQMVVTGDGNVGIGTTIPSHALTVAAASGDAEVHIQAQGNDGGDAILYFNGSSTNQRKCAIISSNVAPNSYCKQDLHFCMETTNDLSDVDITDSKMVITNAGNVGIGVTSPDCNLEIYGDTSSIKLTRSRNNTNYGCAVDFALLNSANEKFTYGRLSGCIADNTDGSEDGFLSFQVGTNGNMRNSYEEEKMRILSNGNVGIGTSSPQDKLHTDIIRIGDWNGGGNGYKFSMDTNAYLRLQYMTSQTVYKDIMTLRYDTGNVGIGTTIPGAKLDVKGEIKISGSTSGGYQLSTDSTGNQLNFTHGSYSWGKWSNAHHYDVYSASDFTGSRDLYLNYYSGAAVRLTGNVVVSSDDRIKTNERYITDATETLLKLRPQIYDKGPSLDGGTGKTHVESGLIVQDIYYDAPELRHLVHYDDDAEIPDEKPYVDDDPQKDPDYSMWGTKSAGLNYEGLIAYLIKSNQELHTRIKALENAS